MYRMSMFQVETGSFGVPVSRQLSLHAAVELRALLARSNFMRDDECTTNDIHIAGKRQAKKYICKALSFGVRSGYLIPTDRQGNMLRVCPTLDTQSWNWRRADIESRQRRRIARRGKSLTTIAERKAMRRGIPRDKFLYSNMDNKQTASKRKTRPAQNSAKNLNTRESNPQKSLCKSLYEKSKPKAFTRKNRFSFNLKRDTYCNFFDKYAK